MWMRVLERQGAGRGGVGSHAAKEANFGAWSVIRDTREEGQRGGDGAVACHIRF